MPEDYYHHRNSAHRYQIVKTKDDGDIQLIDANGLEDEQHTQIMRVYPHGFTSYSPKDSHLIALGLGGRRDNIVALGGEHQDYRIKNLNEGESVLYDTSGNVVHMLIDKGIAMNAKNGPVVVTSQADNVNVVSHKDATVAADGQLKMVSKGQAAYGSSGDLTFIGGDGTDGNYQFVMTVAGPSTKVKAKM
jgi:phage gp45-like